MRSPGWPKHADRLVVTHHIDDDSGVVTPSAVEVLHRRRRCGRLLICGPGPFMDTVEATVLGSGVPRGRVHLERFSVEPVSADDAHDSEQTEEVVIELDAQDHHRRLPGRQHVAADRADRGLRAPSSCETGSCGTCMARVVYGSAKMLNNDALDDDEVAEGWVLTCQSLPTSQTVHVVYE